MSSLLRLAIRLSVALAALLWLTAAPQVQAQETKARAKVLFNQGVAEFEAGQPREALASFEAAYRLTPHPAVRVNMANCFEQLGRLVEAVFNYERFLEESGDSITPTQRSDVETAIASLSQRIGTLVVELSPSNAVLRIDGEIPKTLPSGAVQLGTGRYDVSASADGFLEATRTVVISGQEETHISLTLEPEGELAPAAPAPIVNEAQAAPQSVDDEVPAPPAPDVQPEKSRALLWVAAGTTAALAVGFGVTGGLALAAQGEFEDSVTASNEVARTPAQRELARLEGLDAAERADRLALVSDVLLASSVAAGGATLLIWLTGRRSQDQQGVRAGPMIKHGGGGVMLRGKF